MTPSLLRSALLACALLVLAACTRFTAPDFDDFDATNPIKTTKSYKKEAVRGLKTVIARHYSKAKPQPAGSSRYGNVVVLRKGNEAVMRLYVGEDWIGFQACDPQGRDWSQPIYEDDLDAEDRRLLGIFLRY